MQNLKLKRIHLLIALGSTIAIGTTTAFAGAYQLPREYNAVEIGNSGSGGAALASDASTAWANPAGMVRLKDKQLVISGDALFTHAEFKGSNTNVNAAVPLPFTQTGNAGSTDRALIPAIYFVTPLSVPGVHPDRLNFGLSINSPFGLSTSYANNSVLRYSGTLAKIQVIDVSPSLGVKVTEDFSLGLGADIERVGIDIRAVAGLPIVSTNFDSTSKNIADGWGYGFHAGLLYQLTQQTRVGFAYHSSVVANVSGTSTLTGPGVNFPVPVTGTMYTSNFRTKMILPPYSVLSAHHDFNARWAVDGTVGYTQWSALSGTLTAYNLAGLPATGPFTVSIPQHYSNTWMFALGGSFQLNADWLLRAGVSFDQSPVKSSERITLIPDSNRVGLSAGAHYAVSKALSFDAGYMYLMFNDSRVSAPLQLATQTSTANGSYENTYINIVGLQMNWSFV